LRSQSDFHATLKLPTDYKVVLLKNEFGDIEVDSQLAKQSSLAAVSEILNECMYVSQRAIRVAI
jgi:G3E family GTPase